MPETQLHTQRTTPLIIDHEVMATVMTRPLFEAPPQPTGRILSIGPLFELEEVPALPLV